MEVPHVTACHNVYPVYILQRTAREIYEECHRSIPREMLGRLLGYRLQWQGKQYVKIVDWVSGDLENSHVSAQFTPQGVKECESFLDERYGQYPSRPKEIGLFHSHPFGVEPHFSSTDYQTFLTFPYDRPGNVFILIDPCSHYFKTFVLVMENDLECSSINFPQKNKTKQLQQVPILVYNIM